MKSKETECQTSTDDMLIAAVRKLEEALEKGDARAVDRAIGAVTAAADFHEREHGRGTYASDSARAVMARTDTPTSSLPRAKNAPSGPPHEGAKNGEAWVEVLHADGSAADVSPRFSGINGAKTWAAKYAEKGRAGAVMILRRQERGKPVLVQRREKARKLWHITQ